MTVAKLDISQFMTPNSRASQNGDAQKLRMMTVNKINEIIDALGTIATAASIEEVTAQLVALINRVMDLEFTPAEAITDVPTTGVSVSVLNLAALQALGNQSTQLVMAVNKILPVMRNRKEIKQ